MPPHPPFIPTSPPLFFLGLKGFLCLFGSERIATGSVSRPRHLTTFLLPSFFSGKNAQGLAGQLSELRRSSSTAPLCDCARMSAGICRPAAPPPPAWLGGVGSVGIVVTCSVFYLVS
eukprot:RCo029589